MAAAHGDRRGTLLMVVLVVVVVLLAVVGFLLDSLIDAQVFTKLLWAAAGSRA